MLAAGVAAESATAAATVRGMKTARCGTASPAGLALLGRATVICCLEPTVARGLFAAREAAPLTGRRTRWLRRRLQTNTNSIARSTRPPTTDPATTASQKLIESGYAVDANIVGAEGDKDGEGDLVGERDTEGDLDGEGDAEGDGEIVGDSVGDCFGVRDVDGDVEGEAEEDVDGAKPQLITRIRLFSVSPTKTLPELSTATLCG